MNYWLMKTEPGTFSIDDLKRKGSEHWDGVRNYGARNNMQKMKKGDQVLIYHSGAKERAIVGVAEVTKEAYPDFTAFDPKSHYFDPKSAPDKPVWYMVDVRFLRKFKKAVSLEEVKQTTELAKMVLLRSGRLSVQPVQPDEFGLINKLAG